MTSLKDKAKLALELSEMATPGPWESYNAMCCPDMGGISTTTRQGIMSVCQDKLGQYGHPMDLKDAVFCSEARTLLPELATAYLELKAAHDKLLEKLPREYDEYREEVRAIKKEEAGE